MDHDVVTLQWCEKEMAHLNKDLEEAFKMCRENDKAIRGIDKKLIAILTSTVFTLVAACGSLVLMLVKVGL